MMINNKRNEKMKNVEQLQFAIDYVTNFIDNEKFVKKIYSLKSRWSHECAYENFDDYVNVVKQLFDDENFTFKFVKMTQSFAITLQSKNIDNVFVTIKINKNAIKIDAK